MSCCTFSFLPPAVVLFGTFLAMPAKFDTFVRLFDLSSQSEGASFQNEKQKIQRTKKGCTCKFPFQYGKKGDMHENCIMVEGMSIAGYHPNTLWCDTGPECGPSY